MSKTRTYKRKNVVSTLIDACFSLRVSKDSRTGIVVWEVEAKIQVECNYNVLGVEAKGQIENVSDDL